MKRILSVLAALCPFLGACQLITIQGKVMDETGGPVAGATITLKGTNQAATSDAQGVFLFKETTLLDTLVVSATGYEAQEVPNNVRGQVTVILHRKIQSLQEVTVSTGYQVLPRERATGSFTQLDNAALNQQVGTGILERLEGMVNGLMVDRKTKNDGQIMIRGLSTITGPRDPLIVLDNFPYEGDIRNINPNDVESITVLKDAAAASIWGARAGNGVIVITTKKGRYNSPLKVEFNTNLSVREQPDLFYGPQLAAADFIEVEQFLFSKGYRFADTASASRLPFSPVYELLFRQRRGQLSAAEAQAQIDALKERDVRNDFNQYLYQRALEQQYAVNLRGGAGVAAWTLSAGYDATESVLADRGQRLTLRAGNSLQLHKRVELHTGLTFSSSRSRPGRPGFSDLGTSIGSLPPYTDLAQPLARTLRSVYTDTAGGGKLLDWKFYPLEEWRYTRATTTVQGLLADLGISYTPVAGIRAAVSYRYQQQATDGETLYDPDSYFVRDLVNRYTALNRATGALTYRVPKGAIRDGQQEELAAHNLRGELSVNRSWAAHSLSLFGGAEVRGMETESAAGRAYGYNPDIRTSVPVDYATAYPLFLTGSAAFVPSEEEFGRQLDRFVSFFGNGAYSFRQKYTVSVSGRKDASNLFGLHTNQKWNPLWSAGAAWELSREGFYRLPFLPYLKLRATYGYSGNIDPTMSAVTTLAYSQTSPYTGGPTARPDKFYDPDLRWERVRMMNTAVDFRVVHNRVWGSLEYFRKRSTDLFATVPVDPTAGLGKSSLRKNVATTRGQGMDLELASLNTRGAVQWSSQLNLNAYWDEVVDFYIVNANGSNFVGNGTTGLKGHSIYSVLAYRWGGLDGATGDPIGFINGQPSTDYTALTGSSTTIYDLAYKGRGLPTWHGSLGNTVSWKGFSLTARVGWKLGYYFRRSSISYTSLFAGAQGHADYALRWQKAGDEALTSVPSLVYPANSRRDAFYTGSEVLVERGDHIRLHYLNLAYELERKRWKALPMERVQVYVVASQLGILWKANRKGIDPDYPPPTLKPSPALAVGVRMGL